jgi:GNAT superfamily N-acetyltransferase
MIFRSYTAGDEMAICALYSRAYRGKTLDDAAWRWRFLQNPTSATFVELAFCGDRLVAHYAVTPVLVSLAGHSQYAALSGTTMTDPEFSGRGLFPALANRVYERLASAHFSFIFGFPNTNSHRGFIRDLGWRDVWEVPILRLHISKARVPRLDMTTTLDEGWDSALTKMSPPQPTQGVGIVRDGTYLSWRYQQNPTQQYRVLSTANGGLVVFKRYGDELQLLELLGSREQRVAVAGAIVALAQEEGCATVGLWLNLHDPLHRELERWGFENSTPVTYLGARPLQPEFAGVLNDYSNWSLSMGDSDVF